MSDILAKLASKVQDRLKGGEADGKEDYHFIRSQLREGTKHEREHTKSKPVAKEIAKDHLAEHPEYYKHLKKMEAKLKSGKKVRGR